MRKPFSTRVRAGRVALPLTFACLAAGWCGAHAAPIVIGQSLPLGSADDGTAIRLAAGAAVYVEAVNANGGIRGRPLQLITLRDDGDQVRHARNLRTLVRQHKAVAFLNCVGEASCAAAAMVATELEVPLIGPVARSARLTRTPSPHVFRVRPPFEHEANALARQLQSMGVSAVALLTESAPDAEPVLALQQAVQRRGLTLSTLRLDPKSNPRAVDEALTQLGQRTHQAAVLDLSVDTLDGILRSSLAQRKEWPLVLTTTASGALNAVISVFSSRVVGFTSVVPNPELNATTLSSELQKYSDRLGEGIYAVTYAGMEGYINTKICVEAMRRAGPKIEPETIAAALAAMTDYDLGGFSVSFARGRPSGSDRVDVDFRSRSGQVVR